METEMMGRVVTQATIENLDDLFEVRRNRLTQDQVRRVTVEALVDTGATTLSLPSSLIQQLGLKQQAARRVVTSVGLAEARLYDAVRLTIQGRICSVDVLEVPDDVPPLIGQVPLENLDFVVDPQGRRLIGNPAHGGEHILEMY